MHFWITIYCQARQSWLAVISEYYWPPAIALGIAVVEKSGQLPSKRWWSNSQGTVTHHPQNGSPHPKSAHQLSQEQSPSIAMMVTHYAKDWHTISQRWWPINLDIHLPKDGDRHSPSPGWSPTIPRIVTQNPLICYPPSQIITAHPLDGQSQSKGWPATKPIIVNRIFK